jgi:NitT/TauT family transport system substrate-binding protein
MAGLLLLSSCAPAETSAPEVTAPAQQPTDAPTQEVVHLKFGVLSYMSHSPIHIAAADGYFDEQGLDVELVDFGSSDRDMLPAMLNGQLDGAAAIITTATMHAMEQGGNIKYVADKGVIDPNNACTTDGWLVRKPLLEDGTFTLADIKGLKFSTSRGNAVEYANDLLLERAGVTYDDLEIVDISDQVARLESLGNGSIDMYAVSEPWLTRAVNTGNAEVWMSFSEVIPDFSFASIIFGPGLLDQDPDVGVRFMVAYLKAIEQYNQGKTDRNLEIISGFTQLSPDEVREVCWTSFQPDGKIASQGLLDFQQWAYDRGYVDSIMDISQMWEPLYVEQANEILNK